MKLIEELKFGEKKVKVERDIETNNTKVIFTDTGCWMEFSVGQMVDIAIAMHKVVHTILEVPEEEGR